MVYNYGMSDKLQRSPFYSATATVSAVQDKFGVFRGAKLTQIAWYAALGISRRSFTIHWLIATLLLPISIHVGHGNLGDSLISLELASLTHPLAVLIGFLLVMIGYALKVFPFVYGLSFVLCLIMGAHRAEFWEEVQRLSK